MSRDDPARGGDVTTGRRLHATPPGVVLGPVGAIRDGRARGYVLQMRAGRFHGFVVRRAGRCFGYVDSCPHFGLPLAKTLDDYLLQDGSLIVCGWHTALFEVESGICIGGPCVGQRLTPWPVHVTEDGLTTLGEAQPA